MRWSADHAMARRDDHLARTRRITAWIVSSAVIGSLGLAAAFGSALPGRSQTAAQTSGSSQVGTSGSGTTSGGSASSGSSQSQSSGGQQLNPPPQQPAAPVTQPVVSSGGS